MGLSLFLQQLWPTLGQMGVLLLPIKLYPQDLTYCFLTQEWETKTTS